MLSAANSTEESVLTSSFLSFPPVACQSDCALPMAGTSDGDAISRCQVLSREGSAHHWADLYMFHGMPYVTVTSLCLV